MSHEHSDRLAHYELILGMVRRLDQEKKDFDSFYPANFFALNTSERKEIEANANSWLEILDTPRPDSLLGEDVDRAEARRQYSELSGWNRESHNLLTDTLEQAYRGLASRVADYAAEHQEALYNASSKVRLIQVPYTIAPLPPNLFDHRDPSRPFIPETNREIARLVSEFEVYNQRLMKKMSLWSTVAKHDFMGDVAPVRSLDLMLELQRRRETGDQTFASDEGRQSWIKYNETFKKLTLDPQASNMTLHQNASFIAYGSNRNFTDAGGFFEKTDGRFESFLLADCHGSESPFTSQIRVPVGYYGLEAAQDLALGTHTMMRLVVRDKQFAREARAIANNPATRLFLQQHLMRSRDNNLRVDAVEHGIIQTALEGLLSVSATFAAVEADGVPGCKEDVWEGVSAILASDLPVKATAIMPQAVAVPMTLHGDYFREPLVGKGDLLRIRPEVAHKWQEIHDRRTAAQHMAWSNYYHTGEGKPPVRFGLHCPFKSATVREFAETLTVCRAVVYKSQSKTPRF